MILKKYYKQILFILFLTMVSLLYFLINIKELYLEVDFSFHINRLVGIVSSIRAGQLLDKVYPLFNYEYGYATPLFYCDVFFYPFAILYMLGLKLYTSFILMVSFYSFITIVICYICLKEVFKKEEIVYLGTILYVLSNYRLYDVWQRVAVGEVLALVFIPLVFLSVYKILVLKKDSYLLLAISFSLLVLSHLISTLLYAMIFFLAIVVFIIINRNDLHLIKRTLITIIKGTFIAILLCSFFIFPMFEQLLDQRFNASYIGEIFKINETSINALQLINPNPSEISIGFILFFISFGYIFVEKSKVINFIISVSVVSLLFVLGIIKWPEALGMVQFLSRLFLIIYPMLIVVACYVTSRISSQLKSIVISISVIFTLVNCVNYAFNLSGFDSTQRIEDINKLVIYDYYDSIGAVDYCHEQLGGGEYLPISDSNDYRNEVPNIIVNYADKTNDYLYEFYHDEQKFEFELDAKEDGIATIPVTYYKGYIVTYDGINKANCFKDDIYKRVSFEILEGTHSYSIRYKGTYIQAISEIVSLISLISIVFTLAKKHIKTYRQIKEDN